MWRKEFAVVVWILLGCDQVDSDINVEVAKRAKAPSVAKLSTVVAEPGATVSIEGKNFSASTVFDLLIVSSDGSEVKAKPNIESPTKASFQLSDNLTQGEKTVVMVRKGKEIGRFKLIVDNSEDGYDVWTGDAGLICKDQSFINKDGAIDKGTKECTPTKICTTNGEVGCIASAAYQAADLSNLSAGVIKAGTVVAGVTGEYPSSSFPLPLASSLVDLDAATFNAKIKASASFEYWNSAGERQLGGGDSNLTASNIKDSMSIFGESGTFVGNPPNPWDVRRGVTVAGVQGKLKLNCRNAARLASFDQASEAKQASVNDATDIITVTNHGWAEDQTVRLGFSTAPSGLTYNVTYYLKNVTTNTVQLSLTNGGSVIDILSAGADVLVYRVGNGTAEVWDTIDDFEGYATTIPNVSGWTADHLCGGVETVAGDDNIWKDVTTIGDGVTPSTCSAHPGNCTFMDKVSNQEWRKPDTTQRSWQAAIDYCDTLTYNGKSDWRLPTLKELAAVSEHGFISTGDAPGWISLAMTKQSYWTATTSNTWPHTANYSLMGYGVTLSAYAYKSNLYYVLCTRP